jgi:hypothetical protein
MANTTEAEMRLISVSTVEKTHNNTVPFCGKLPTSTAFIAKLVGIYVTVISLVLMAGKGSSIEMMISMVRNPELLFVLGILGMTAGAAIILVHNVWSGGALSIIVTLVGWTAAIKGITLMVLAAMGRGSAILGALQYERFFYLYMGFAALLGLYLAISGVRADAQGQ